MFFKETIDEARKYIKVKVKAQEPVPAPVQTDKVSIPIIESVYRPPQKDSLFWCYYILVNGETAYETIGNRHFVVEKNEKIKLVELARTKKTTLKRHKIPLSYIENDLTNGETISVITFLTICILCDKSLVYIDDVNNTFLKVSKEEEVEEEGEGGKALASVVVVYRSCISQRFECDTCEDASIIQTISKTHYELVSISKPIHAISSYKVPELLDICTKLRIATTNSAKNLPKQFLYNAIKDRLTN